MNKNNNLRHDISIHIAKLLNLLLITVPFAVSWMFYYSQRVTVPFINKVSVIITALFILLYYIFAKVYDSLSVSFNKISVMVTNQMLAALISDFIIYIVICLLSGRAVNVVPGIIVVVFQFLISFIWSLVSQKWYYTVFPPKKTLIIEDFKFDIDELISKYELSGKYNVVRKIDAASCIADLSCLKEFDVVFIGGVQSHERNIILKQCVNYGIDAFIIPKIGDTIIKNAKDIHLFRLPVLRAGRYSPTPEYLFIKRFLDILFSILAIIILSPFMLVVALFIKASDGGPVLYKQTRLTKDGKQFLIYKFRSMKVDAEDDGVARLSSGENDSRITPIGRFIRKIRADELPQLFNILGGSMSFVGPRPERPEISEQYERDFPEFRLRLQAKAGLTGYAQVYGKYNTTPYDKLMMDMMYISHPSISEDITIMLSTVKVLFLPESTEGISEDQVTAARNDKTDK